MGKGVPNWALLLRLSVQTFEFILHFLMYGTSVASLIIFDLVILKLLANNMNLKLLSLQLSPFPYCGSDSVGY